MTAPLVRLRSVSEGQSPWLSSSPGHAGLPRCNRRNAVTLADRGGEHVGDEEARRPVRKPQRGR